MLDPTNVSLFEWLSLAAGLAPILVLAAFAVLDLRALMLVRAVSLMKQRVKPGEMKISRDEWAPARLV